LPGEYRRRREIKRNVCEQFSPQISLFGCISTARQEKLDFACLPFYIRDIYETWIRTSIAVVMILSQRGDGCCKFPKNPAGTCLGVRRLKPGAVTRPLSNEVCSGPPAVNKGGTTRPRSLFGWRIFCIDKETIF
jgi:hypothetical protein